MDDGPRYDVFISHGDAEADVARRLRKDLSAAHFHVAPDSIFSPGALANARVVVTLQSRHKPSDPVRAAMATAQATDQPTVAAHIRDDTLALRRNSAETFYDSYDAGAVALIHAIWAALGDPRGQMVVEHPLNDGETLHSWIKRQPDPHEPNP